MSTAPAVLDGAVSATYESTRTTAARTAGLLYLLMAITGGFSMLYVPSLIVPGDAAATASNIVTNELLFRIGVVSGLICQVVFVFLVLALHGLFKDVNRTHAAVMVALVVAAVPVAFLNMLNQLAALHILSGPDYLSSFETDQLNALAMLLLDVHGLGLLAVEMFWGLWLFPLGWLVIKARFAPSFIGVLLIIGCFGYAVDVLARLLLPDHAPIVAPIAGASKFGELAMIVWLLVRGVRRDQAADAEA